MKSTCLVMQEMKLILTHKHNIDNERSGKRIPIAFDHLEKTAKSPFKDLNLNQSNV